MAIDRLWVDLADEGVNRSDLVIRNESEDVYYVTVTPFEITNPGLDDEERVTVTDPEQLGLLVTPNRLVLQPGDLRAIRLVSLNRDLARERTYRVDVRPELGEIAVTGDETENRGLAVKLLAAFDVLVTVRPNGSRPDFAVQRGADFLELANNGGTSMVLLNGKLCPAQGTSLSQATIDHYTAELRDGIVLEEGDPEPELALDAQGCVDLPGRRLYAGNSWRIFATDTEFLKFNTRWRASQELQPLEVRCAIAGAPDTESEFCRPAGSVAETGAAVPNSPYNEMEQTL